MDFIYLYETAKKPLAALSGAGRRLRGREEWVNVIMHNISLIGIVTMNPPLCIMKYILIKTF
jgi:hypothetical protein